MQTVPPPRPEPSQTTGEMLWEVVDLTGGAAVMLLPLLLLAVPGIAAFIVLPAIVLLAVAAAPVIVAGAVVVPAYLLVRAVRPPSASPTKDRITAARRSGWSSGMSV